MTAALEASHIRIVAEDILALEEAALRRWCKGDPSGFLELCAEDVVYFDPYLERRMNGLAALTAYYESIRGKVQVERFEMIEPYVQLIGDAAVLTFNFVSWGEKEEPSRWNCTEVFRRRGDGWRIIQTHWSYTAQT
ncbi:MAG: DUF4440 domain-containing protein [Candidatus Eisenbacteria bacterium]